MDSLLLENVSFIIFYPAQLVRAVEYTDCISAEG